MTTASQTPIKFNPFLPGFQENPYPHYQMLRRQNPIHQALDMWVITQYQDILQVLESDAVSSRFIPQYVMQQNVGKIPGLVELGKKAIVFTDPPDHRRLRRLAGQAFNNVNINRFSGKIQALIESLLKQVLQETGKRDIQVDFAQIAHDVPLYTLSHFLGIPEEHILMIDHYMHRVRSILEPTLLTKMRIRRIESDLQACLELFQEIIDYRKNHLGNDLLSQLIQANAGKDRLSDSELGIFCVMTFIAGHETSKGLLVNGLFAFAQYPQEWQDFRLGKVTSKQVIDEVLRFDPPLQQTIRLAVQELQVGNAMIQPGEKILLCLASGNRDEVKFSDAETFKVGRDASAQIAFGHGIHNCLGQMIARLEGRLLFEYLRDRIEQISLTSGDYRWKQDGFITRTLTYLPLTLSSACMSSLKGGIHGY